VVIKPLKPSCYCMYHKVCMHSMCLKIHRYYVPEQHLSTGLSNGTRLFSVRYEVDMCVYVCMYIYIYINICTHTDREREREGERQRD